MDYSRLTKPELIDELKGCYHSHIELNGTIDDLVGKLKAERNKIGELGFEITKLVDELYRSKEARVAAEDALEITGDALEEAESEIASLDFDVKRLNGIIDVLVG